MTAAQVIALGKYLEPDFDPASLTVSQLLGVLGYHNIQYPTPYNKSKLVQLFNEDIKSRATKFRKDRLKKENSIASDDGITDGLTGKLIGGPRKVCDTMSASHAGLIAAFAQSTVARRTSRRLSRAPADEDEEISPIRPEPVGPSFRPLSHYFLHFYLSPSAGGRLLNPALEVLLARWHLQLSLL